MERWQIVDPLSRITLSEWNARKEKERGDMARRVQFPQDYANGLICECGGMLYDTLQQMSPGRMRVKCVSCGFKGERQE